jgi:hypothetical protein|tara:strand:+ start:410 stop:643 length:234 start_codon:yes stop_codon:yes gene_type:complete
MEEIHDIHDKILHSVVGLLKEGRDPLQVAGCLLAGAVQLYQLELGDDQTTDFLQHIAGSLDRIKDELNFPSEKESVH